MGRATTNFLAPPPGAHGRVETVKYHIISITKSISKIYIPNFVCVLSNERYKTYQMGFSFCRLGHAQRGGGSIILKYSHVAYQIDGDDEQNRMQVQFLSQGQTGDLG